MKYTEEMILHSDSGYCMPFEEPRGKDVELSLGYGEQVHPTTGEKFFHHGIDFKARCYMLSAVASGIVSGVGNDPVHGICQTVRYGGYEVTYGHLSNVFAQFINRKTFCDAFPNHFVSILHLLTQNELRFFIHFPESFKWFSKGT